MQDLSDIQKAIEHLPSEAQARLAAWMAQRDREQWDAELERDFSPGGAGMKLLEKVDRDIDAGKFQPFAEGRKQHRPKS